eukprot:jgi/Mesen1/9350/ME000061S08795
MEEGVQRLAVNVELWNPNESEFLSYLHYLPSTLHQGVLRYLRLEDRKRALVSRLLQRKVVNAVLGIPYDQIDIRRTTEGKPYLATPLKNVAFPNFNFNVSHHGDFVVLASEPLCLVGVDVMTHDAPREAALSRTPLQFFESFQSCYTPFEWKNVHSVGPEASALYDQFYRYWCMKEAYIKAVGIGLGFDLLRAEFHYNNEDVWSSGALVVIDGVEQPKWRFSLQRLGVDHWVCVAKGPPEAAVDSFSKVIPPCSISNDVFSEALHVVAKPFEIIGVELLKP